MFLQGLWECWQTHTCCRSILYCCRWIWKCRYGERPSGFCWWVTGGEYTRICTNIDNCSLQLNCTRMMACGTWWAIIRQFSLFATRTSFHLSFTRKSATPKRTWKMRMLSGILQVFALKRRISLPFSSLIEAFQVWYHSGNLWWNRKYLFWKCIFWSFRWLPLYERLRKSYFQVGQQ